MLTFARILCTNALTMTTYTKPFLLAACMWLTSLALQAQPASAPPIDSRLLEVYQEAHLKQLQQEQPFHLQYYNYFLDNGYEIQPIPAGKTTTYPTVRIDNLEAFNILKVMEAQALQRAYDKPMYYRIEGQDKLLVLKSERAFIKALNTHLGRS